MSKVMLTTYAHLPSGMPGYSAQRSRPGMQIRSQQLSVRSIALSKKSADLTRKSNAIVKRCKELREQHRSLWFGIGNDEKA
jgi:hypothetical protein